jgi:hypothetical protein
MASGDIADDRSLVVLLRLDEAGKNHPRTETTNDIGSDEAELCADAAKPRRTGDGNSFPLGEPAGNSVRTRSDRGARAKSGVDHQEYSER